MTQTAGYTINVNLISKVIDISVRGAFSTELVQAFLTEYQQKVSSISAKDFILKVDSTDMNIITQQMLPTLENSFTMYKNSGFKEIHFIIKPSPTIKMQVNRLARNIGLTNARVVEL